MKSKFTLLLFLFAAFITAQAQDDTQDGLSYVGKSDQKITVPSLASRSNLETPIFQTTPPQDGRSAKVNVIPGKDPQTKNAKFMVFVLFAIRFLNRCFFCLFQKSF